MKVILRIVAIGVALTILLVLYGMVSDFGTVLIAPLFFDVSKQEMMDLAIRRLEKEYLLSFFVFFLPICLIVSLILNLLFKRRMR